ncbi:hypothetical protein T484DRAFT_1752009 [Baffinella frigidus]|nr:hypothetical protein T484DRAFT_1752009 [Cryptophyta sp. CCMP2293]
MDLWPQLLAALPAPWLFFQPSFLPFTLRPFSGWQAFTQLQTAPAESAMQTICSMRPASLLSAAVPRLAEDSAALTAPRLCFRALALFPTSGRLVVAGQELLPAFTLLRPAPEIPVAQLAPADQPAPVSYGVSPVNYNPGQQQQFVTVVHSLGAWPGVGPSAHPLHATVLTLAIIGLIFGWATPWSLGVLASLFATVCKRPSRKYARKNARRTLGS